VESGRSTRFASGEEMNQFFAIAIREVEELLDTDETENRAGNH
jgi:hypothetical protein